MHNDINHWTNLVPPAAPSDEDFKVYQRLLVGNNILLLGSTKALLPLATVAYDLCPKYEDSKIVDRDWLSIDSHFDTIIGDGVFNLGYDFGKDLLKVVSTHCNRFIVRCFLVPPIQPPKYAISFPLPEQFEITPAVVAVAPKYNFYMWDFK